MTIRRAFVAMLLALGACATPSQQADTGLITGTAAVERPQEDATANYLIGPNDLLEVFVWRSQELSTQVRVRPDGRISTPLVEDMLAAGKTPTELANDIEASLREYVKTPQVTVIVQNPVGGLQQQVRVIGQVAQPAALPYQANMTVLDVMIAVGGLNEFAAGNRAKLIRGQGTANEQAYRVRLNDLMRRGDVTANVPVRPGDVIIVPESRW